MSQHTAKKSLNISSAIGRRPVIAAPIAGADDRLLGDRRVAHALRAESVQQALGRLEHAAGRRDVLADEARPIGSRSISWAMPAATAARYVSSATPSPRRSRARSRAPRPVGSGAARAAASASATSAGDLRVDRVELRRGRRPPRAARPDSVGIGSRASHAATSSAGRYLPGSARRVAAVAVGQRLDQRRAAAGAGAVDDSLGHGADRVGVVAVDDDRLEAVGGRPVGRRVRAPRSPPRSACTPCTGCSRTRRRPALPHRGHVERLVERADVRRAVAEEADRDLARLRGTGPTRPRPAAIGRWAPTIAYEPIAPCSTLVRCIEPPLPPIEAVPRPSSSAMIGAIGTPRASVWSWPR